MNKLKKVPLLQRRCFSTNPEKMMSLKWKDVGLPNQKQWQMPQLDKLLRAAWVVDFGQPFLSKIWTWDMDGYRHSPDTKPFDKFCFLKHELRLHPLSHVCRFTYLYIYIYFLIYIYIVLFIFIYIYTYYMYDYAHLSWHVALVFFFMINTSMISF